MSQTAFEPAEVSAEIENPRACPRLYIFCLYMLDFVMRFPAFL